VTRLGARLEAVLETFLSVTAFRVVLELYPISHSLVKERLLCQSYSDWAMTLIMHLH